MGLRESERIGLRGCVITGAYAALQDWSGLCRFAVSHSSYRIKSDRNPIALFDIFNDPQRMLSERAGACFFLREDVRSSEEIYPFLIAENHLSESGASLETPPVVMKRLGLIGKTGCLMVPPDASPVLPRGTRAALTLNRFSPENALILNASDSEKAMKALLTRGLISPEKLNLQEERFTSSTGELVLDRKKGTFHAVTPFSEGFVVPAGKTVSRKYAEIKNIFSRGVFFFSSRDGKPLSSSRRVLILHLTDTKNTGMSFSTRDLTMVEEWGKLPLLMKRGQASVSLNAPENMSLYACSVSGRRLNAVPAKRNGDRLTFSLENVRNGNPVMVYELTAPGEK